MNRPTILIIVVILALIGGGYYLFSRDAPSDTLDTSVSTLYTEEIATKLAELKKVKDVSLNFAVFDDKLFKKLHLMGRIATSTMTRGRTNPFLPF